METGDAVFSIHAQRLLGRIQQLGQVGRESHDKLQASGFVPTSFRATCTG